MDNIISIKGLSKSFTTKFFFKENIIKKIVDNLNLDLKKGEILGLIGESGCGKSTTGELIVKLLKKDSGKIYYDGRDIDTFNKKEIKSFRKDVQIIFQDPYNSLNKKKKVKWILEEPMIIHNMYDKKTRLEKIQSIIELAGFDNEILDRYPSELSGGQRQRISILSAILLEPKVIIADEAVSALDVSIQAQILNFMKKLQGEFNLTYLFISHDLNVVYYLCDRIAIMKDGKIIELGSASQVYFTPKEDYTKSLLKSIPKKL